MDYFAFWIVVVAIGGGIIQNIITKRYKIKMAMIEKGMVESAPCTCQTHMKHRQTEDIISDDPVKFTFSNVFCLTFMGAGISAVIALCFSLAFNQFLPAPPSAVERWGLIGAAAANYAAGAIFVIVSYTLSDIYKIYSWSMEKRTLVHFIALYAAFFICSYLGQWINWSSWEYVLQGSIVFVGIYAVTWFFKRKEQEKQSQMMNEKLNQIQND